MKRKKPVADIATGFFLFHYPCLLQAVIDPSQHPGPSA
jgi:hypothetical protein